MHLPTDACLLPFSRRCISASRTAAVTAASAAEIPIRASISVANIRTRRSVVRNSSATQSSVTMRRPHAPRQTQWRQISCNCDVSSSSLSPKPMVCTLERTENYCHRTVDLTVRPISEIAMRPLTSSMLSSYLTSAMKCPDRQTDSGCAHGPPLNPTGNEASAWLRTVYCSGTCIRSTDSGRARPFLIASFSFGLIELLRRSRNVSHLNAYVDELRCILRRKTSPAPVCSSPTSCELVNRRLFRTRPSATPHDGIRSRRVNERRALCLLTTENSSLIHSNQLVLISTDRAAVAANNGDG